MRPDRTATTETLMVFTSRALTRRIQMWFHLSKDRWKENAITELLRTKNGYGEPEESRFSVAPSVGRAYLACPHTTEGEPLFIYQVHVQLPIRNTNTADYKISHEHIITEAVLADENGRIPMSLLGQVLVGAGQRPYLRFVYSNYNLDITYEEEAQLLWEVSDGLWRFANPSRSEVTQKLTELRGGISGLPHGKRTVD